MKRVLSIALVVASLATSVTLPQDTPKTEDTRSFYAKKSFIIPVSLAGAVVTALAVVKAITFYKNKK